MNIHSRMKEAAQNERGRRWSSYEHNHKTTLWSILSPKPFSKKMLIHCYHTCLYVSVLHTRIGELVYGCHLPHNAALHQGFEAFRVFSQDLKRGFRKTCSNVIFLLPCASLACWSMRSFHRQPSTADVRYFQKPKWYKRGAKEIYCLHFVTFLWLKYQINLAKVKLG